MPALQFFRSIGQGCLSYAFFDMKLLNKYIPPALALVCLMWFVATLSASEQHATLYDGTIGDGTQTPDQQSLAYLTIPIPPTSATQQAANGITTLDTTGDRFDHAGYFGLPSAMPTLDRTVGYTLSFTLRIIEETHADSDSNEDSKDDRAGFSVILISDDLEGIELGFWKREIWAQHDGTPLFTHNEGVTFPTTETVRYDVAVQDTTYTLMADSTAILTGSLRNYSAFPGIPGAPPGVPNPYTTPNILFLGDNTTAASARFALSWVAIAIAEPHSNVQAVYLPLVQR